jgi:hypothetical protein
MEKRILTGTEPRHLCYPVHGLVSLHGLGYPASLQNQGCKTRVASPGQQQIRINSVSDIGSGRQVSIYGGERERGWGGRDGGMKEDKSKR